MRAWTYLAIAIVAEVIATSALKAAAGFSRPGPSAVVVIGYGIAFYFLSLTLQSIPVGVTYAIWSGVGIVLITLVAWLVRPGARRRGDRGSRPDHRRRRRAQRLLKVGRALTRRG